MSRTFRSIKKLAKLVNYQSGVVFDALNVRVYLLESFRRLDSYNGVTIKPPFDRGDWTVCPVI